MNLIRQTTARRQFLGTGATLSALAVAMLGGREALAQGAMGDTSKDVQILNVALGQGFAPAQHGHGHSGQGGARAQELTTCGGLTDEVHGGVLMKWAG